VHAPLTDKGHFEQDKWELYHVDVDRSESMNLADTYPDKLEALIELWNDEADKNFAKPLDDRTTLQIINTPRPTEEPERESYTYYPHTSQVPEAVAVNIRGKSYKIIANVEIGDKASGVIFAHGSRFGGHSLFIKDKKLYYVYNFLGIKPEQVLVSGTLKPGKYTFGLEFTKEKAGEHQESIGTARLYVNDKEVAKGPMRAQVGKFTLVGDGLCIGYDRGDNVSQLYKAPGRLTGGEISFVTVNTGKEKYLDLEKEAARAFGKE